LGGLRRKERRVITVSQADFGTYNALIQKLSRFGEGAEVGEFKSSWQSRTWNSSCSRAGVNRGRVCGKIVELRRI